MEETITNRGTLRLVADPESLSRSGLGTRSGVIYFEIGDSFFPSRRWTDLAPDFAYAWINGVMSLVSGASNAETVFFMDGPYLVELAVKSPGVVDVHLVEDRPQGRIARGSVATSSRELLENAVVVMGQMKEACEKKGWQVDPHAVSEKLRQATDLLGGLAIQGKGSRQ